ncbi:MAG: PHB depolymerase family esterase [Planctomycetota bacterium]|nr:PHB depolymerase family esterase [Planctomycetota bacterium]
MRQPLSLQSTTRTVTSSVCRDVAAGTRPASKSVALSPTHRCYFGPLHYESGYAYPVFVWLHGAGANEHQLQRVMPLLSTRNYVGVGIRGDVRLQNGEGYDWSSAACRLPRVVDGIMAAVNAVTQRYHVNSQRVFLAGLGTGGATALQVGVRHPEEFAGVISLGDARLAERMPPLRSDGLRGFPILVARQQVARQSVRSEDRLLRAAGVDCTVCESSRAVSITEPLFGRVNAWIMERAARHLIQ